MKIFQNITILVGTIVILVIASTGLDRWKNVSDEAPQEEYFAIDPNNPDGEPIKLNGKLTSYAYQFPTQNGVDYSKDAISKAIIYNIRTGSELVLGLLYERLAFLEFKDGNFKESRVAYASALNFYMVDNQKLRAAETLTQLAHLEAKDKNYQSAKEHYLESSTLFAQINAPVHSDYTLKLAARLPIEGSFSTD